MAKDKKEKRRIRSNSEAKAASPFKNYWDKSNYMILFVGLAVLTLGFFLLAQGPWDNPVSMTISPLVLLLAYLVIIPLSILYKKKKVNQ